jgi:hypothetical protein
MPSKFIKNTCLTFLFNDGLSHGEEFQGLLATLETLLTAISSFAKP